MVNRLRSGWQRFRASRAGDFIVDFVEEWQKDRCGGLAAEIAFFGLLGVFPTLLVMAATFGWLGAVVGESSAASAEQWVVNRVTDIFGADSDVPDTISDLFASSSGSAVTIGAVALLYTGSRGFAAVVRAIDVAYDHPHRRGWLGTRVVAVGLTVGTIVVGTLVVSLLVLGPLLGDGAAVADALNAGDTFAVLWDWVRWPVALLLLGAWAATIYHVSPNQWSPWRWDLPGAGVAMLSWLVSTWGFGLYLDFATRGENAVFGILGSAISLLLWFYVLAMGLMAGAEVNAILVQHHDQARARRQPTYRGALRRVRGLLDRSGEGTGE